MKDFIKKNRIILSIIAVTIIIALIFIIFTLKKNEKTNKLQTAIEQLIEIQSSSGIGIKFPVKVTQADLESGINITACKWVFNTTGTEIGTNEASYTGGSFSSNPETIAIKGDIAGVYYLHILSVDNAGNKKETISRDVTVEEKFTQIFTTNTTYYDNENNVATIPAGFAVGKSEGINNISNGLVITDKTDETGKSIGNEFVWIPVANASDLVRTAWSGNNPVTGIDVNYTEPYQNGYSTEKSEYEMMRVQTLEYKGFYIGRYEAGVNTTTLRTGVTNAQTVVIKKGVAPYNYVPWGKAMNDASEIAGKSGVVYLSKNLATQQGYTSVTSTLCYGSQWDAMCRFIGNSGRTTSTKPLPELTGSVSTDISKNIYDLAGNLSEWTMEAGWTNGHLIRGASQAFSGSINNRYNNAPDSNNNHLGFRPTLYIKGPTIPEGFYYAGGTEETGFVISDVQGDDLNNTKKGNQFVWIPVKERTDWVENLNYPKNVTSVKDGTLPTGITAETIAKKGGFYIARFEAGKPSGATNGVTAPLSKKGVTVWINITQADCLKSSALMYNNAIVASGLITGSGWDVTMKFISNYGEKKSVLDSSLWGNYNNNVNKTGNVAITGYNETWQANHIYDLGGNAWEYINEENTSSNSSMYPCIFRGGDYGNTGSGKPASYRYNTGIADSSCTFRVALYLK